MLIVFGAFDVTLTDLVPDVIRTAGFGFVFGSLKKNAARTSPQLSEINSALVIVAVAPEVLPITLAPTSTYP